MKKRISLLLATLICVLTFSACVGSIGKSNDYKSVANQYVVANFEGDGEALLDLYPEKLLKKQFALNDMKKGELIQQYNTYMKEYIYDLNGLDSKWAYRYSITDEEDIEASALKDLSEYFREQAETEVNLSAGKYIYIHAALIINGKKHFIETRPFAIYNIDGVWCCFDDNLSFDIKQEVRNIMRSFEGK